MEDSPPEVTAEGEPMVVALQETLTGQSRLAYRLAAGLLLINSAVALLFALPQGAVTPSVAPVIIDSALAIGLLEFHRGARTLVLLRAGLGVAWAVATAAILLLQSNPTSTELVWTVGLQLAYAVPVILLLTGRSNKWRFGAAVAIFAVALVAGQVWEPIVNVIQGETADDFQIISTVLVAVAIGLLLVAVVLKQRAQDSRAKSWIIGLLGIASVAALALSSRFLLSSNQVAGTWLLTLVWAAVAAYVLVHNDRWRRALVTTAIILLVGFSLLFVILSGLAG